jgi:hypothetical protein
LSDSEAATTNAGAAASPTIEILFNHRKRLGLVGCFSAQILRRE